MPGNNPVDRPECSFGKKRENHWRGQISQGDRLVVRDYFVIDDVVEIVERFREDGQVMAVLSYGMQVDGELDDEQMEALLGSDHCDDVKYQVGAAFDRDVSVYRERREGAVLRELVDEGSSQFSGCDSDETPEFDGVRWDSGL